MASQETRAWAVGGARQSQDEILLRGRAAATPGLRPLKTKIIAIGPVLPARASSAAPACRVGGGRRRGNRLRLSRGRWWRVVTGGAGHVYRY